MQNICAIIPCRYNSSRLPGKALLKINNISVIQQTYNQVCHSKYLNSENVYIACDGYTLSQHINTFTDKCIVITQQCLNGTERICHSLQHIKNTYDIIVNVQGDEPYIDPLNIDVMIEQFLKNITDTNMVCTTIHTKITNDNDLHNNNIGKIIINNNNDIMYASRGMIPYTKDGTKCNNYEYISHVGAFVFRRIFLENYMNTENTPAQLAEDIEWLKILELGYKIKSYCVTFAEIGVNTFDDYNYLLTKYTFI
jgi:3-deoxy-manno-octulosonate cytidylyltransferase (CMP-KDO synthetase)